MKNKIIICLSFCFILFVGLNFVNADTTDETLTKEEIFNLACEELKADGHNYCIGMDINSDGNYVIYAFDYEPYILQVDGINYLCIKESDDGKCYKYYVYYTAEGVNLHSRIFSGTGGVQSTDLGDGYHQQTQIFETSYPNVILSSFDILDDSGNVFFQAPVQEITLAQVLEKNSPVMNFQTMMSGIIPYLIAFMITLLAFWKGWRFLSNQLRKA